MQRYEPRRSADGWLVFDSLTGEVLTAMQDRVTFGAASALSALLNDIEGIGRAPVPQTAGSRC